MKKRTIFDIFLIFSLLILLVFLGNIDYSKTLDKEKFDKEYSLVDKDNVYKYINEDETYKLLDKGSAIIFMGFSESKWANNYAKILNESAKDNNIKEIYYYDFHADRAKKSIVYNKIVEKLKPFLKANDEGEVNIQAPTLVIVKDGVVIAFDDETSYLPATVKPQEYWNNTNVEMKKEYFVKVFNIFLGGE